MVGSLLGTVGSLPDIYTEITISYILMKRVVGKKPENGSKPLKVKDLIKIIKLQTGVIGNLSHLRFLLGRLQFLKIPVQFLKIPNDRIPSLDLNKGYFII